MSDDRYDPAPVLTRDDLALIQSRIERHMVDAKEPARDSETWPHWNTQRRWRELARKIKAQIPLSDEELFERQRSYWRGLETPPHPHP